MNRHQYLIGIDLGTSIIKTCVFDLDGNLMGLGRQESSVERPKPTWVEQDPELWWSKTIASITLALSGAGISATQISSIGLCGQGHGPTPVSKDGQALYKCIHWSDRRSTQQVNWVKKHVGTELGNPRYTAVKIMWLKQHHPDIYKKTYKFLLPTNFIGFKLTGEYATDYTNANETDMYDPWVGDWSDRLLKAYGIDYEKLPTVHHPWEIIGRVTKVAEQETGLRAGTPVVAGGGDWACTEYGAGYIKPGRAVVMMGTTFDLAIAGESQESCGRDTIIPEIKTAAGTIVESGGTIFRWFRDEFYCKDNSRFDWNSSEAYDKMSLEAQLTEPSLLLLPHFLNNQLGTGKRQLGLILGLSLSTTRGQIARSIMEGVGYEMKRGVCGTSKLIEEIKEIRVCGGAVKNKVWQQILADIFDLPVCRINIEETGCFGAAILAGLGIGLFPDPISPIEKIVRIVERTEPRKEYVVKYKELFKEYCRFAQLFESFENN